jgi:hypothetical protein
MAMVKTQYNTDIKEWMSDAGGEYKSDAFLKTLKDAGFKILQSAPHSPQQNGHAERFMHTVIDKAQSMRLETCLPDSWWEFTVLHAVHCYNWTPLRCHQWQTPYTVLNNMIPDISHLKVFGCGAYVHIPKARHANALAPKSELMVYIGHIDSLKADTFMCLSNNTLFTSDTALFDETIFPKCKNKCIQGTTRICKPRAQQPPIDEDADKDTTPGDFDNPSPSTNKKEKGETPPVPDRALDSSDNEEESIASVPSLRAPEPAPLRRSDHLKKIPTCPGNVYGDRRHPTAIEKDVQQKHTWRRMTEHMPGSFGNDNSSEQPETSSKSKNTAPPSAPSEIPLPDSSDNEVDDLLRLQREGESNIWITCSPKQFH